VVATIQSALRKTGDVAQALGDGLNTLQQAQDNATQAVDLLHGGIGNLTDADMGKVSAQIAARQIQKQLAAQSLTLDNQAAGLILQLFK
jgi:flagellin